MNYSKTTLACAIIIAFLLILTSTLIILDHYEIIVFPTEALVTLGIITVVSPLVYLCATFFQSKVATIEKKTKLQNCIRGISCRDCSLLSNHRCFQQRVFLAHAVVPNPNGYFLPLHYGQKQTELALSVLLRFRLMERDLQHQL